MSANSGLKTLHALANKVLGDRVMRGVGGCTALLYIADSSIGREVPRLVPVALESSNENVLENIDFHPWVAIAGTTTIPNIVDLNKCRIKLARPSMWPDTVDLTMFFTPEPDARGPLGDWRFERNATLAALNIVSSAWYGNVLVVKHSSCADGILYDCDYADMEPITESLACLMKGDNAPSQSVRYGEGLDFSMAMDD